MSDTLVSIEGLKQLQTELTRLRSEVEALRSAMKLYIKDYNSPQEGMSIDTKFYAELFQNVLKGES